MALLNLSGWNKMAAPSSAREANGMWFCLWSWRQIAKVSVLEHFPAVWQIAGDLLKDFHLMVFL